MKAIFSLLAMMFIFMVMSPQVNAANADNGAVYAWDVGPPVIDNIATTIELPEILYVAESQNLVSFADNEEGSLFYDMITAGVPEPRMIKVCGLARDAVLSISNSYLIHVGTYEQSCYPGKFFVKWNFNLF